MRKRAGTYLLCLALFVGPLASLASAGDPPVDRLGWSSLTASADPSELVARSLDPATAARVGELRSRVAHLRASLDGERVEDGVAAVISTAGGQTVPVVLPAATPRDHRLVEAAPAALRETLAGLVAAVRAARDVSSGIDMGRSLSVLRQTIRRFPVQVPRATRGGGTEWLTAPETVRPGSSGVMALLARASSGIKSWTARHSMDEVVRDPSLAAWLERSARRLEENIARSRQAALLLAAAVDAYAPALREWDGGRAGRSVKGCDVVDQAPLLCVGSEADNEYKDDVIASIDLGGADVYENRVATVVADTDPARVAHRIGLGLDLGSGDDSYRPADGTGVAVSMGGAALLVDEGGDDEYLAQTPPPVTWAPGEQLSTMVVAQAYSALGGAAFLVDRGGADSYLVLGRDGTDDWISVEGQASLDGVGAGAAGLLDFGADEDRYVIDTGRGLEKIGNDHSAKRDITGQAYAALGGAAVLYDEDGKGEFSLRAEVRYENPKLVDIPFGFFPIPSTWVDGQALSGIGGEAFLLTGEGDTTYEISLPSTGWRVWRRINGQARSFSAFAAPGSAVIDDVSGNDTYSVKTSNEYAPEMVIDASCNCSTAEKILEGIETVPNPNPSLFVQGNGGLSSSAMIHDHLGDDDYVVASDVDFKASLVDKLKRASLPPAFRVFGLSHPTVIAQGWGQGPAALFAQPVAGSGTLLDESGTDSYSAGSRLDITARVVTRNGKPDVRLLYGYGSTGLQQGQFGMNGESVYAQGSSASGYVVDLAGTGDTFDAYSDVSIETVPAGGGYYQAAFWPMLQGGEAAGGGLIALGEDPAVTAHPSMPVYSESPGVHGFGLWTGCCTDGADPGHQRVDRGSGYGYVPLAKGGVPEIEIFDTPATAMTDPRGFDRLPVAAKLTGPDGKPLARQRVHFNLQWAQLVAAGTTSPWQNIYQDDVVTNRKGIAKGSLPLWIHVQAGDDLVPDGNVFFRVLATFDGTAELQPRHAAHDVSLDVLEEGSRKADWLSAALRGQILR